MTDYNDKCNSDHLFATTEYCERYAKKENITSTLSDESDEEISDEDVSDGRSLSSEDDVAGDADP